MISLNLLPVPHHHLIAHRGARQEAPENTLASFERASEAGFNWIEFDVRLTKDDRLVIFHDDSLERTTNGKGLVINHTLAELKQLEAGSWFSASFSHQKIPTLIETLAYLKIWNLIPVIEIKCTKNQDLALTKKIAYAVADCLKQYWIHTPTFPMVSSFDHNALLYYRERLNQPALVGFLVDTILPTHLELARHTLNSTLHCDQRGLTPYEVKLLQKETIPLFIYTINNKKTAQAYLEAGASAIFTDNINLMSS